MNLRPAIPPEPELPRVSRAFLAEEAVYVRSVKPSQRF
jgi:hypothetical protein